MKEGKKGRKEKSRRTGTKGEKEVCFVGFLGPTSGLFNIPCRGNKAWGGGGGSGLSNYGLDSLSSKGHRASIMCDLFITVNSGPRREKISYLLVE